MARWLGIQRKQIFMQRPEVELAVGRQAHILDDLVGRVVLVPHHTDLTGVANSDGIGEMAILQPFFPMLYRREDITLCGHPAMDRLADRLNVWL